MAIRLTQLSTPHLLGIKELTADDIELIFSAADNFKDVINRPIKKVTKKTPAAAAGV